MMTESKNILITGASGYLGSVVLAHLQRSRIRNGTAGKLLALDIRQPPAEARLNGVDYLLADIRSSELARLIRNNCVKTVVHLASIVPDGKRISREFAWSVDVEGTENLLQACVDCQVDQLIVSSSGAAYGYYDDNPDWIGEEQPLRGNETFPYAWHKRKVEELLDDYRRAHPQLRQTVFRISTILGAGTDNAITRLFERKQLLAIRGSDSPFVFIWDADVGAAIEQAIRSQAGGIYNLAGDGALSMYDIGAILNKPVLPLPANLLYAGLWLGKRMRISIYGPEQLDFLRYRPVLLNTRLKEEFGFIPEKSSREAFEYFIKAKRLCPQGGNS